MFDIGFWELAIIGIVGLIVIGPDKLPGVARTLGKWVGRTRRLVNQVKTDIDLELKQDELRKMLEQQSGMNEIKETLNSEQYSFEDEKDYLVNAMDDAKLESTAIEEPPENAESFDDDGSTGHSDPDDTVKHERT
ncbi:Twin-arginine translocation protein TatB [hydrothermal vent metagenome]|uniref:Twin-arginine translocation protein TatB n=1 Tax=hydrothermal vent metagenome TaxID=652676 RepID=A0A3B1B259_9ZZZZ